MTAKIKSTRNKDNKDKVTLAMEFEGLTFHGPKHYTETEANAILAIIRHQKKMPIVKSNASHRANVTQIIVQFHFDHSIVSFISPILRNAEQARRIKERLEKWQHLKIEFHVEG